MGLFSKQTSADKWNKGARDLQDRAEQADRNAKRRIACGARSLPLNKRREAELDRELAKKMDKCARNPRNGGKGWA